MPCQEADLYPICSGRGDAKRFKAILRGENLSDAEECRKEGAASYLTSRIQFPVSAQRSPLHLLLVQQQIQSNDYRGRSFPKLHASRDGPDAFLFEYAGGDGDLIKLTFKPNSGFRTPSREGKVLHEMAGEMWVDAKQQRLVSITGQLANEVKFAGGLLGHLEKGGQFTVKRTEVAPAHWEVTEMALNMRGKALRFKTISLQRKSFTKTSSVSQTT
jgi:hypothetical protein